MDQNKGNYGGIIAIIIILIIIILGAGSYLYYHKAEAPTEAPAPINDVATTENASNCGLNVDSPTLNQAVTFPLTVTGRIDNSNTSTSGCSWAMFEGQGV